MVSIEDVENLAMKSNKNQKPEDKISSGFIPLYFPLRTSRNVRSLFSIKTNIRIFRLSAFQQVLPYMKLVSGTIFPHSHIFF